MSKLTYSVQLDRSAKVTPRRIEAWFIRAGYQKVIFRRGSVEVVTRSGDNMVSFQLEERMGHTTYYKQSSRGGLIVFEVSLFRQTLNVSGYGFRRYLGSFLVKAPFKQYRFYRPTFKWEGFHDFQRFVAFAESRKLGVYAKPRKKQKAKTKAISS